MSGDEWLGNALVLCMKGLLYHSLACVLYHLPSEKTPAVCLRLLALVVPLVMFDVVRRKCGKFFMFLLCHVIISGIFMLIFQGLEERAAAGICVVWMALASIYKRFTGDPKEGCPPIGAYLIFFAMYAAASQSGRQYIMKLCCYEAFLFLILFVTYRSLTSTSAFLKSNENIKNLPAAQLRGLNRLMFGVFLLFFIAGMLLVPYLPVSMVFDGAADFVRLVLRGLIWLLLWIFSRFTPETETLERGMEQSAPTFEPGGTSVLMQILEKILMTAFSVLAAAGLLYLAGRLIYRMYQRFYDQHKEDSDESEFLWKTPVLKERIVRQRRKKRDVADRSVNQRIRRMYKKNIRRRFGTKAVIAQSWTPTEWEYMLHQKQADARNQADARIHTNAQAQVRIFLYEKARYSQHECDKQELEAARKSFHNAGKG
ncbi:MAG: hypothetical protein K2N87_00145 [Eubacterium sp.]|nr:hypothetical protein [Eubacterium sp.]